MHKESALSKNEHKQRVLIRRFTKIFFKNFGYYPTIITAKRNKDEENPNLLSLNQLAACFEPFLPKHHNKTLGLSSKSRIRELTELRHMFCYIARCMNFKVKVIGQFLNNRDHTTVIHGTKTFEDLYQTDPVFREKYHRITNHIKETYESSIMESIDKVWN